MLKYFGGLIYQSNVLLTLALLLHVQIYISFVFIRNYLVFFHRVQLE
jgi:hypothetical protein